jgi:CheY-like chemotaxis protein
VTVVHRLPREAFSRLSGVLSMAELKGLRVLVVEDSPVVAMATGGMLEDLGCVTVGPAPNFAAAIELIEAGGYDAAIVDLNIRGEKSFRLLKLLDERQIPYLIASGYADWSMPDEWAGKPRLPKPFGVHLLKLKLEELEVDAPGE